MKESFWRDPLNWILMAVGAIPVIAIVTVLCIAVHFVIKFW